MRADSGFYAHALVAVCGAMDVRFSITIRQHARLRNIIEAIPETDCTPIPYWMDGAADVAETSYAPFQSKPNAAPVRLIVRRVKPAPGSQLALFVTYSYHGFITDRDGATLELEADHRRHAEIENAIRDFKSPTTPLTAFTRPLTRTGMKKSDTSRLWIYWSSVTKTPTGRWTDCRTSTVSFPAEALLPRCENFGNISQ